MLAYIDLIEVIAFLSGWFLFPVTPLDNMDNMGDEWAIHIPLKWTTTPFFSSLGSYSLHAKM
ncbi:MAG: hypothetical protein JOS17DRAFT_735323 [Linnemannia elongata]|nr:MAG: hypothetical protein JOS17DRAFT_735323 [Linnemannia elongata]